MLTGMWRHLSPQVMFIGSYNGAASPFGKQFGSFLVKCKIALGPSNSIPRLIYPREIKVYVQKNTMFIVALLIIAKRKRAKCLLTDE